MSHLTNPAPGLAQGSYSDGYATVARTFARSIESGEEVGASVCIYRHGECVVDLWGGLADRESRRPWQRDTRIVVFSVTKGFAAMAFHLLDDRGEFDWDAPVAEYWPGFARNGKEGISVRTLLNHQGGLAYLTPQISFEDCVNPQRREHLVEILESEPPSWAPGSDQGYHAITFGLYARELFERIAHEPMADFLRRELLEPLDSDVWLGAPADLDDRVATLYTPSTPRRVARMVSSLLFSRGTTESHVAAEFLKPDSTLRKAFTNPAVPNNDVTVYNKPPIRRANLAWASATGSARGVARAYLPFAQNGVHDGQRFFSEGSLKPVFGRQTWSDHDQVLQKPVGWSQGFLKEERHLFSPNPESFGHAGMGGALGWCDPVEGLTFGYAQNSMDWRIRSPRAIALCRALYDCEALSS